MALTTGACRFGLWWVHVDWSKDCVHHVSFAKTGAEGPVPPAIRAYCAGRLRDQISLRSVATEDGAPYAAVYRAVCGIPYGSTATYGKIAWECGTSPRVVGIAMRRNPTPLVIPCHRVVAQGGLGGFTPDVSIKQALLAMEQQD
ncbi:methylated-DNA--[protein]-cysteine S-methyltransferase [Methanogenium organophilum]|uniref:MGMT family protein n=1 Tax=Methanogenium organophilum TaxID=2199 RepID=A0A9X9T7F4_METOG|nr:MGMT family protein [Methanogenium organophilum]WAI00640.1 MGMT family protein [Methanogenium organophilum]